MKNSDLTEEEKLKLIKNARAREKAKEQRRKQKLVELQKQTIEYQKKINDNRKNFGLQKNKLQSKMSNFFLAIKKDANTSKDNG